MKIQLRVALALLAAAGLFSAGYTAGQNKFGLPGTIIHVSLIKWKPETPDAEKQKILDGVKEMAAQIPGIKNVWMKVRRMQPRDYHAAFVFEFESQAAAEAYVDHPAHVAWSEQLRPVREASISPQVTN